MKTLKALTIAAAGLVAASGCAQQKEPEMRVAPAGETLIFADEFNAPALDRSKWEVIGPTFWVNEEEQAYIDSEDTIFIASENGSEPTGTGSLFLKPQFREGFETPTGRKADFVSGRITSQGKFDFTYGRAVGRIRMPDATGVWPAFWLLGNGEWPGTGEIDIMEYVGEPDWIGVALHGPGYSGETPLVNKYFFDAGTDITDWHEYEVDWNADRILFKVDGRLIYRVTRAMVENYGEWRFDTPKHIILNFAVGGVYPFKTNGISEPYKGMPAETAERIKRGELVMEVDWVRVYQAQE
ncbi:glycoside hydrolase family 16 protein [Qipengyuania atrilutea]|uniref:Glycoside hydrolase family 16 protein n=1 Tax=Qipengyuania atrilutea TaxID=2744473 RepID=A0A850H528_9SPHN|nr:glycoside hydrolase family 16 protein [Actirhodobacter atriluteus]NVD45282.1 glycoside hydrolase family 16 protein [Actirhodobacter atriluteus]